MASYSDNLLLSLLALGESGVHGFTNWGEAANSNIQFLEDTVTEAADITLAGSNVTLTAAEERALYLNLTGTLSANVEVCTNDRKGFWFVSNGTSGSYTVTVKPTSGSGVVITQGHKAILYCDGTNIVSLGLSIGVDVQAYDADLAAIAALAKTDGNIIVGDGTTWVAESGATARASLGLAIGTHVQAYDADLAAIAALTSAANKLPYSTGAGTWALADFTSFGRSLVDDADESAARSTLGLGDAATGTIGVDVQAYDADTLKADTADVLTAGFGTTAYNAGTQSSGTYTPDEANGNIQYAVNGGAHTLAPMTNNGTVIIHYTNNGSAGAITVSGFTLVEGDSFTTTDTDEFLCYLTKANDVSHLVVKAL
jgi:hypothetical protein